MKNLSNDSSKIKHYEKKIGVKPELYFWDDSMSDKYKNDSRQEEWAKQREKLGFDSRSLWDLRSTLASFIYPRLKAFEEYGCSYPGNMSDKEWRTIIRKMARAFELMFVEYTDGGFKEEEIKEIHEGLQLFATHYMDLWD